jgi:hypothetical protein
MHWTSFWLGVLASFGFSTTLGLLVSMSLLR